MLNFIYKGIIALFISFGINFISIAEDELLFDDELVFEDSDEEFGEWDDGIDIFGDNDINTEKSFSWLDLSVTQNYGVNPASNYSTAMERTELRLGTSGSVFDSGYGEVEIKAIKYWPSDSNNVIEASDIDVEKAFLQFSFDDWSAKLGRYTIGWGELEGGALDVINPSGGLTDPSMISQWILSSTRYFEDSDLSFFYNTNPRIAKSTLMTLKNDSYDEFGLRYGISGEGSDMAFYAGQLVPNDTIINLTDGLVYATPYQLLGFGVNKAFDDYLLKFDVAYKHNLQQNRSGKFVKVDRIDWDLAFDIQKNDRTILISVNSQHLLDFYNDYLTPTLTGSVSTDKNSTTYMARVNDKFGDSDWSWNTSHIILSNNDLSLTSAGLDWDINDYWKASLGVTYADAKPNRALSLFDQYKRVNLEVKYQY
jgi:hypothetical protein